MINLKAQFLAALGDDDAAHATFSEALMLFTLCAEAWVGRCFGLFFTISFLPSWRERSIIHALSQRSAAAVHALRRCLGAQRAPG